MVLFASQNLLRDPPFSKLNVISCRNVLIYIDKQAQERLLETFHFALKPGGYLFLGSSESADGLASGFSTIHKKSRIFQRDKAEAVAKVPPSAAPIGWAVSAGVPITCYPPSRRAWRHTLFRRAPLPHAGCVRAAQHAD